MTGIQGYPVTVEAYCVDGMPMFEIVGLPDAAVKESRERVRAAMSACRMAVPRRAADAQPRPGGRAQGRPGV
ncbi:MAG: magnesium chelatase domain-containing protein [Christensenellales bacterium]